MLFNFTDSLNHIPSDLFFCDRTSSASRSTRHRLWLCLCRAQNAVRRTRFGVKEKKEIAFICARCGKIWESVKSLFPGEDPMSRYRRNSQKWVGSRGCTENIAMALLRHKCGVCSNCREQKGKLWKQKIVYHNIGTLLEYDLFYHMYSTRLCLIASRHVHFTDTCVITCFPVSTRMCVCVRTSLLSFCTMQMIFFAIAPRPLFWYEWFVWLDAFSLIHESEIFYSLPSGIE